jgi:hypothetical protein
MGSKTLTPKLIFFDSNVMIKTFTPKIAHESRSKKKSNPYLKNNKKQQKYNKKSQQTTTTTGAKEAKLTSRHLVEEMDLFCTYRLLRS